MAWEFEKYTDGTPPRRWWHRGRCLVHGDGVAFWALAEAVRGRVGLTRVRRRCDVDRRPARGELATYRGRTTSSATGSGHASAVAIGAGYTAAFTREDLFAAWTTFFERVA